jgi:hypothetical protein
MRLTPAVDGQISDLLTEAGGFASLFLRTDPSPWTGAELADGPAVQRALDLVQQIHSETLPRFLESVKEVTRAGHRRPESSVDAGELADLSAGVQTTFNAL